MEFGGWSMPVQYTSIVAEHTATRTASGLFDISHMGRLRFDGADVRTFLEGLVTRRVVDMRPGQVRYSLITNDDGAILDDILVYQLQDAAGGDYWVLVVNASNRRKVVAWIETCLDKARATAVQNELYQRNLDVTMTDVTTDWAMIAVQGPRAIELLQPLVDVPLAKMKYYTAVECRVAGHGGVVSRTGYTGEDGCELMVGNNAVVGIWQSLVDAGAQPCGLGSRDTLRLEAGMPLYGHEISEGITPWAAGLDFAVNLENRTFPGSTLLHEYRMDPGQQRRVGIVLDSKRVPREGMSVALTDGRRIGDTTSGTFSPTLNKPIAMALVEERCTKPGTAVTIGIRDKLETGTIVEIPFYRRKK